jgi:hypothetical protein
MHLSCDCIIPFLAWFCGGKVIVRNLVISILAVFF